MYRLGGVCAVSPLLPNEFVRLESGMQAALEGGLIADGIAAVQDVAAGLVVALLDPQRGDRVADVCAAPGGKALLAAARLR
jgi:16S rRNA (cytosine967-C5)-methyltransferase